MLVEILISANQTTPKIIIETDKITDEVTEIIRKLSDEAPNMIVGAAGDTHHIIDLTQLIRVYSAESKVFAVTDQGEYVLRQRLYELEERLDKSVFVRISNSEIVNLKKVKSFDLSLAGTICVKMSNGSVTYVSRRFVSKIKKVLGL